MVATYMVGIGSKREDTVEADDIGTVRHGHKGELGSIIFISFWCLQINV